MTAPAGFPPADCRPCGRCCFDERAAYIPVFGVDLDRMGDRARSLVVEGRDHRSMRFDEGRCAALVIDPARRTFSCGIYDERPDVCRALARGSGACLEAWTEKAGRPDVALGRLLRS